MEKEKEKKEKEREKDKAVKAVDDNIASTSGSSLVVLAESPSSSGSQSVLKSTHWPPQTQSPKPEQTKERATAVMPAMLTNSPSTTPTLPAPLTPAVSSPLKQERSEPRKSPNASSNTSPSPSPSSNQSPSQSRSRSESTEPEPVPPLVELDTKESR